MLSLSFILAVSIPTVLVVAGLCILYFRFRKMEDHLQQIDRDLRQFYRDLGRPKADIIFPFPRAQPTVIGRLSFAFPKNPFHN